MTRHGQFTVRMPDGMTVERLPVGYAASEWWITFVLTGFEPERVFDPDFSRRLPRTIVITADGKPLEHVGTSGGGSERVQHWTFNYRDSGASAVSIAYNHEGREHDREELDLSGSASVGPVRRL